MFGIAVVLGAVDASAEGPAGVLIAPTATDVDSLPLEVDTVLVEELFTLGLCGFDGCEV